MKYLLIDFGASNFKSVLYDSNKDTLENEQVTQSIFLNKSSVNIKEIKSILDNIIGKYKNIDMVLTCSILGGYYVEGIYYSWKCLNRPKKPTNPKCLISGLFENSTLHAHQARSIEEKESQEIRIIGTYKNIPFLSSLGDTECALSSVDTSDQDMVINLGTGSQVIFNKQRYSFIPSGRALLVFSSFFHKLGEDFFKDLQSINLEKILTSSLNINLNVFEGSYQFSGGGVISGILEENFNYENLISSILKSYIDQYANFIVKYHPTKVCLIGGISKKLKVIKEYFEYTFPNIKFINNATIYSDTHLGMTKIIKKLK